MESIDLTYDDDDFIPATEYCPVSIGVALLGDRWSLLIVRELIAGSTHFNEILWGLPGLSRGLMSSRLRRLERLGILTKHPASAGERGGYALTEAGLELLPVLESIGLWTLRWQFPPPSEDQCDPSLLLWRIAQGVPKSGVVHGRACIEFRFLDHDPARGWIRLEGGRQSVCFEYPDEEPDVIVTATPKTLTDVWYGHERLDSATRSGGIQVQGASELATSFPRWFNLSRFSAANLAMRADVLAGTSSGSELASASVHDNPEEDAPGPAG